MRLKLKMAALAAAAALIAVAPHGSARAGDSFVTPGTLIGAAAGGLLGSTIGQGQGQLVATAAGTLLGAGFGYILTEQEPVRTAYVARRPEPRRVVVIEQPPRRPVRQVVVYKTHPKKACRGRGWRCDRHDHRY
ncbi:hypothetical protein JCM17960_16150 [Magnetospira thiophila]